MSSSGRRLPCVVLGGVMSALLTACQTHQGAQSPVSAVQFADIPVPDGLQLQDRFYRSSSIEIGEFRHGVFLYSGAPPVPEVRRYLLERMPLHSWALTEEAALQEGAEVLRFRRGKYLAECRLSRKDAVTTMHVTVRTSLAAAEDDRG